MKPVVVALTLWVWLASPLRMPAQSPSMAQLENQAIALAQQLPLAQLDPSLPNRPFGKWFEQVVGSGAGVSWQLTDCGEQAASADRDLPACVEATAVLPNDRMIVVSAMVGSFRRGLSGKPQIHFIAIEDFGQLQGVKRLSELAAALRRPVARATRGASGLPRVGSTRYPALPHKPAPPLLIAFDKAPGIPIEGAAPPPPPGDVRLARQRVSEGVLQGNVVTKVSPIYPAIARQINASGEVKVQVTIGEDGRVMEAVAVSGHPILRTAAEDAARKWLFKPTTLNGKPVQTQGTLTFVFERPQ
jgi:TonB family protein